MSIHSARLLSGLLALAAVLPATAQTPAAPAAPRKLSVESVTDRKITGDFDQMLQRRHLRFAAPYSRTLFYSDKGRERGLTAEPARDFEQYVNRKYAKQLGKRPFTIVLIPPTRTELIENLTGKTIHPRSSSSYFESVTRLNERFRKEGKPPVTIVRVSDPLEDEEQRRPCSGPLRWWFRSQTSAHGVGERRRSACVCARLPLLAW